MLFRSCLLSLFLLVLRVVHCGYVTVLEDERDGSHDMSNSNHLRHLKEAAATKEAGASTAYLYEECHTFYASKIVLALLICSIIFLIFTCSMGCEQVEAISTGQGKIARLKTRGGGSGRTTTTATGTTTELQRVTEEFNEMFGGDSPDVKLHWFNPFRKVWFPRNMKKVVLGYDWNDAWDDSMPYHSDDDENDDDNDPLGRLEAGRPSSDLQQPLPAMPIKQEFELPSRSSSEGSNHNKRRVVQRKPSPSSGDLV